MSDLRALPAQERMLLIEATYGRAMLRAHGLERTISALLICKATIAQGDKEHQDAQIDKIRRLTLGGLIAQFLNEFSSDEKLKEELCKALYFRNELAHRISDTMIDGTAAEKWEESVLLELGKMCDYFADIRQLLRPYMESMQKKFGLSEEDVVASIRRLYPGARIGA